MAQSFRKRCPDRRAQRPPEAPRVLQHSGQVFLFLRSETSPVHEASPARSLRRPGLIHKFHQSDFLQPFKKKPSLPLVRGERVTVAASVGSGMHEVFEGSETRRQAPTSNVQTPFLCWSRSQATSPSLQRQTFPRGRLGVPPQNAT